MKNTVVSNVSFNFIIKATTYLFSFVTLMYVTRVLQPEAFGRTNFADSFAGYFVMFANLGMPIYAMRVCAEKRGERVELSKTFNELWSINVVLSVLSAVTLIIFTLFIPKLRTNGILLMVYGSAIFFQMIRCEWLFKGLEKFRFLAIINLIFKSISLVCIFLFVHSQNQVILYAVLSVFTSYGSSIACFIALHRYVDMSFHIRINRKHFQPILVFFMMSCAVTIYSSLDLTMLGFMKSDYETGLYGIAAKGKTVLAMTGGLVWSAVLPTATKLWKDGERKQFELLAQKSLIIVMSLQFVVMTIGIVFAREIILFVGGEEYLDAVTAFRILLLCLVPIGASNILGGQVLISAGKEHRLLRAEVVGAVTNLVANLILIPYLSIVGAALTTVVSEVIVWVMCWHYVQKDLQLKIGREILKKALQKIKNASEYLETRIRSFALGNRLPFYCPCCKKHLREFINDGYNQRPEFYNQVRYRGMDQEVVCPICKSFPRHRILITYLAENMEWLNGKRILYFAPEISVGNWLKKNRILFTTADLYKPADLRIDIESTGLEDEAYDMIICNHVLEHVPDYKKALLELRRLLCTEGRIIISFPTDLSLEHVVEGEGITEEKERLERFGQVDHLRVFGRDSREVLQNAGFNVTEIRGDQCDNRIKPVVGPADYDYNVLWCLEKTESGKVK